MTMEWGQFPAAESLPEDDLPGPQCELCGSELDTADQCPKGCGLVQRIEGTTDSILLLTAEDADLGNPDWAKHARETLADLRKALAGCETWSKLYGVLRRASP